MKKFYIIFIILTSLCTPRPGVDYLPHIGFFDFIINYFGLTLPETGITGLT